MSLDDLRARAHAHAKAVHEYDLDKAESDAAFAARREALSTEANDLAVALQNYQPTDPPAATPLIRFAQHKYDNSGMTDLSLFDVYDLQRGYTAKGQLKPGAALYLYATIVRRPSDPEGRTQFLPPHLVQDSWCAHTPDGRDLVTRDRGDGPENLINIAVAQWRVSAISSIVDQVVAHGATGVYVDEVDAWWRYAWTLLGSNGAKEFRSEGYWRNMWLTFLEQLAAALHGKGKKLWVNLGADYNAVEPWQNTIVGLVDAINIEFYTGRERVGAKPTTLSDSWLSQNAFVAAVEKIGKPVHVHCSSLDQKTVNYAYCSWLLHTEFRGSFSASLDYGGQFGYPDQTLWTRSQSLGKPLGPVTSNGPIRSRKFAGGTVHVNPTTTADVALGALSGTIKLT